DRAHHPHLYGGGLLHIQRQGEERGTLPLNAARHPRLKAWFWFGGIYLLSLAAFALLTGLARLFIRA
ncbi:MAG TPA: hypothetical protein VGS99_06810, partial [Gammaproteobacteria bacterium]|nr:hypothetical protein [Gammaproteobacteria bacterium]